MRKKNYDDYKKMDNINNKNQKTTKRPILVRLC